MYEELRQAESVVAGTKQTIRALREELVSIVYLADDTDKAVKDEIFAAVGEQDVHILYVPSKAELGLECGIDVPCACAAVLR